MIFFLEETIPIPNCRLGFFAAVTRPIQESIPKHLKVQIAGFIFESQNQRSTFD